METFWRERWASGQIGWHRSEVNVSLARHLDRLTGGRPSRVLVPLCGKSVDLAFLAERGHGAIGVELVEQAIVEFFEELGATPEVEPGERPRHRAHGVEIVHADFFEVTRDDVGRVDCVFDRAALIALPEELRGRYVDHLLHLVAPDARVLLVTLSHEGGDGPPFSVGDREVHERFGPHCTIERLEGAVAEDVSDRLRRAGAYETTWLMTRR